MHKDSPFGLFTRVLATPPLYTQKLVVNHAVSTSEFGLFVFSCTSHLVLQVLYLFNELVDSQQWLRDLTLSGLLSISFYVGGGGGRGGWGTGPDYIKLCNLCYGLYTTLSGKV